MLIAAYTPNARVRGGPSAKVVVISASAAGATSAPPAPCTARAVSKKASLLANPPASEAAENSSSPAMNMRRRPSRSPARPPSSSSPPKVSAYALTTHSRPDPEKPSARWICGSATLTMVASSTTINCAVARTSNARPRRRWPPPAVVPPAGLAIRVALDRVSDMTVSPRGVFAGALGSGPVCPRGALPGGGRLGECCGGRLQGAAGDPEVAVDGGVPDGVGHGRGAEHEAVEGVGGHGDHRVAVGCRPAADGERAGVGAEIEELRSDPQLARLPAGQCGRPARGAQQCPGGLAHVVLGRFRCVAQAPVQQFVECGLQRPTGAGQLVHGHVGRCREGAPGDDAGGLQVLQPCGEDVAGDARQTGGEVAVTARAKGQLPHEQQAPPFADDVQGSGDGACLPVVLHKSYGRLYFYKCQLHWL